MFFRSLGGSVGLAVFGTVLNTTIRAEIPARTDVAADAAAHLIRAPDEIRALPASIRDAVVDSIALGVSRLYWIGTALMVIAVGAALGLPERPLRARAGISDALEEATATAAF